MLEPKIRATVEIVLKALVRGMYAEIEKMTAAKRLNAIEIEAAVADYGRQLVMPPEAALRDMDVIEIEGTPTREWSVRVDLWTKEEGRSDLSLELTLADRGGAYCDVEVDNIHVL